MKMLSGAALVLALIAVSGIAWGAVPSPKVKAVTGEVTSRMGDEGAPKTMSEGDPLLEGDIVEVPEGGTLTVSFHDGSEMDVVGPARFKMQLLADNARTIQLHYGEISRFEVKDVTTGITTPLDTFVALWNGTVSVKVDSVPGKNRAVFNLLDGENAKVVEGRTPKVLTKGTPHMVTQDRPGEGGGEPMGVAPGAIDRTKQGKYQIGVNTVNIPGMEGYKVVQTPGGGLKITSIMKGGFGTITINQDRIIYLAPGQSIELDSNGAVVQSDGITHDGFFILTRRGVSVDPFTDVSQQSYTGTRLK
jgi:hypothetical protein